MIDKVRASIKNEIWYLEMVGMNCTANQIDCTYQVLLHNGILGIVPMNINEVKFFKESLIPSL